MASHPSFRKPDPSISRKSSNFLRTLRSSGRLTMWKGMASRHGFGPSIFWSRTGCSTPP